MGNWQLSGGGYKGNLPSHIPCVRWSQWVQWKPSPEIHIIIIYTPLPEKATDLLFTKLELSLTAISYIPSTEWSIYSSGYVDSAAGLAGSLVAKFITTLTEKVQGKTFTEWVWVCCRSEPHTPTGHCKSSKRNMSLMNDLHWEFITATRIIRLGVYSHVGKQLHDIKEAPCGMQAQCTQWRDSILYRLTHKHLHACTNILCFWKALQWCPQHEYSYLQ